MVLKAWLSDGAPVPVPHPPTIAGSNPDIARRKVEWSPEQLAQAGEVRAEINKLGGEAKFMAMWAKIKNDDPELVLDAIGKLHLQLQVAAQEQGGEP